MRKFDKNGLDTSDNAFKHVDNRIAKQQKRARKRYFRLCTKNYIAYQIAKGTLNMNNATKAEWKIYHKLSKN